ncbi:hypothetical protein CIPOMA221M_12935 [Citrobacter portucalensis]|uniref:hypothetical protein n=1 Tax=Citrobacter portucalensis TaxID=1639133 RepID=UPI003B272B90
MQDSTNESMQMTYIKKTDSRGRNLWRVCYVSGHGLNNQRYESFHEFWQACGLRGNCIGVRTELFENANEGNYEGYHIRMVYRQDDNGQPPKG